MSKDSTRDRAERRGRKGGGMTASQFNETERILEIARAEAERIGPVDAEIVGDETSRKPLWHLLQTHPSQEGTAAAHLAGRGFGVYLPTYRVKGVDRFGRKVLRLRKLFPGYLFLFVWDVLYHRDRILACPGTASLVYLAGEAVVVPDSMIDHLQAQECYHDEALNIAIGGKRKRGRWRKEKLKNTGLPEGVDIQISPRDVLHGAEQLDDAARNSLLRKALGLSG